METILTMFLLLLLTPPQGVFPVHEGSLTLDCHTDVDTVS